MKKEERQARLKEKLIEMQQFENKLFERGIEIVGGVDEVGRGPLAGPVVTAAVALPKNFQVLGVDDSKKLSAKKREELFHKIKEVALGIGIGMCDEKVVDEINILEATKRAMEEAITNLNNEIKAKYNKEVEHVLLDAITLKNIEIPQTGIIKGDSISVSIAAASIIAKVIRDDIMNDYHKKYPHYSFDTNKGYGTKAHYQGIKEHGITPIHRKTFLK